MARQPATGGDQQRRNIKRTGAANDGRARRRIEVVRQQQTDVARQHGLQAGIDELGRQTGVPEPGGYGGKIRIRSVQHVKPLRFDIHKGLGEIRQ